MVAYTKPQQSKKESKRLKGERDQIDLLLIRLEIERSDSFAHCHL